MEELVERLEVDREENSRIARGVTVGTNLENQGTKGASQLVPT